MARGTSCACPGECREWPSPDPVGRVHCDKCGCFTANPNRVHGWCLPGGMAAWQKRMDNAADRAHRSDRGAA